MKIYCCNCKKEIECDLVYGNKIYPHRQDLYSKAFYQCPICKEFVGTHKKDLKPLGTIPTQQLKTLRHKLHIFFEPKLKNKKQKTKFYETISNQVGYEFHCGNISSIEEYKKVYKLIINYFK